MASGEETNTSASSAEIQTSVQCVDNADGVDGVVVYGGETFAMTSEPHGLDSFIEWSCADGQGLYSSVRPFQFPRITRMRQLIHTDEHKEE